MKVVTIDANVVVKWIFPEKLNEGHVPEALNLLQAVNEGAVKVLQPVHWLLETAGVVVRANPKIAEEAVGFLTMLELSTSNELEIYHLACRLSERFNHHIFDTMYHAVALYNDAQFVTSDEKYYKKAVKQGGIVLLSEFSIFDA